MSFWDYAAGLYDLFENFYNGDVNRKLVKTVSDLIKESDDVLECACGTGMISKGIAERCHTLIATDFSEGMLQQAKKNLSGYANVTVQKEDITALTFEDESFDAAVAGNVIHLLDDPCAALNELLRTCKKGGRVILPTYVNNENAGKPSLFVRMLEKFGADFKKQFDYVSYKAFFAEAGYTDVQYSLVEGKMPCAVAVITKK